ncbi:MAG: NFACT family protein [Clostridia bacterium]|nr:NFACT family protein [Clostridia bacterium]
MAIDGIFLHFLKNEIGSFAIGAKIDKIHLPTKYELVLTLRTRTEARKLFISVSGNSPRINFTDYTPENPMTPPMLCMLLRKQLLGAVVKDIRQVGFDRILLIDFDATNEIGDRVRRTLVIEIMAQYSNCILLDENGIIIDSLKRVDASKSSFREILPGREYKLPPQQNKLSILDNSPEEIADAVFDLKGKKLSSAVMTALGGISPLMSKEIAYRITLSDTDVSEMTPIMKERLLHELVLLKEAVTEGKMKPCYLTDSVGSYIDFSYMPLTFYDNSAQMNFTDSLSEILDIFYFEKERLQRAKSKAEDLFKTVSSLIERTSKKINLQREELSASEEAETKRIYAELINANLYSLEKGRDVYEVQNYYDNYNTVKIPVQAHLSPSANSQRYYKEYRKAQTARKMLTELIEKGSNDLEYLLSVQDELSRAETERELQEIRAELSQAGFLKSKTGTKNKKNTPLPPLEFSAPDGFKVYVGRNNIQNDNLSFKKASKNDIWFHAQKAPGSHVILSLEGREPTNKAMEFAASTAAYFSSVKDRGMVEVDYTKVRNLKKPPASNPGFVIYHIYNTVYVKAVNPEKYNFESEDN